MTAVIYHFSKAGFSASVARLGLLLGVFRTNLITIFAYVALYG